MAPETSPADIARRVVALLNRQEVHALDELFVADAATRVDTFSWGLRDREELKAFVMDLYDAFPDIWWEIEDVVGDEKRAVVRQTVHGTHGGKLATFDLDPTGRTIEVGGFQVYWVEENRIVEAQFLWDTLALLRQLGVGAAASDREFARILGG